MEQRGFVFHEQNLLSPDEAVATFIARAQPATLGVEHVALDEALGRVLAQRIDADADYPNAPRSAMDGFAVQAARTPGRFRIVGEIAMGRAWNGTLESGTALRIPTGGVVPSGADAVVPIELATLDGMDLGVAAAFESGTNVNRKAGDMRAGEPVLAAGIRIGAPHVGVLATLGVVRVPVYRRPCFAMLSTGDELIAPEAVPIPGEVRDSNRYAVAAALRAMGAEIRHMPTVGDTPGALELALREVLSSCDGAILTGGSSVGERDHTPRAIASLGEPGVIVHGLRVKPGKPTVLAAIGEKPVIGLPGNPTSALVILEAVLAPIVGAYLGAAPVLATVDATLASLVASRAGWTWYVPVNLRQEAGSWMAHPLALQSSSVSLTARADGFIAIPEAAEIWDAGRSVTVTRFL
jgi:molybdenum cofactor synthesis domain-containing protein